MGISVIWIVVCKSARETLRALWPGNNGTTSWKNNKNN